VNDLPPPGSTLQQVQPGNPEDLDHLASLLDDYVGGAMDATRRLRAMESGGWVGDAADAFRSSVEDVLKRLDGAASAFQEASFALRQHAATLRAAQLDVGHALRLLDQADAETRTWQAKNADALSGNFTAPYTGSPVQMFQDDPGEPLRREAGTLISEAKARVKAAARHTADRLQTAADHAPDKPGFWKKRWHNVTEFAGGAVEATTGMATFAFKLSPSYALIDPEGFVQNEVGIAKGLAHAVTHPVDFAKAVVDWDTWAESPGRALGHLVPAIALALASGGAGAAGKAAEAGEVAESIEATRGLKGLEAAAAAGTEAATTAKIISSAEARELLITKGFGPARAQSYVESFEGQISVRETRVGERFLRYTHDPASKGSFLTTGEFESPAEARRALALEGYANRATYVQEVTVLHPSTVLEGGIAGGAEGVGQTVVTDSGAFEFGVGHPYP
jgi:uncharacterized protein YukE